MREARSGTLVNQVLAPEPSDMYFVFPGPQQPGAGTAKDQGAAAGDGVTGAQDNDEATAGAGRRSAGAVSNGERIGCHCWKLLQAVGAMPEVQHRKQ